MRLSLRPFLSSPRCLPFAILSSAAAATTTRDFVPSYACGRAAGSRVLQRRWQHDGYCGTKPARPEPAYEGHIPLSCFENAFLAAGSAMMCFVNPRRADMVAALGETTAGPVLPLLRDRMLASAEGRRILKDRPRINTRTVDLHALAALPEGTLGRAYVSWLQRTGVTPDTREPVHYIDDPELAYIMQRYRESHDLYHTLFSLPVDHLSELAIKAFEAANLNLPMAILGALIGPLALCSAERRERYVKEYLPWAMRCGGSPGARCLMTVYWEERWAQGVDELQRELGVWDPPGRGQD